MMTVTFFCPRLDAESALAVLSALAECVDEPLSHTATEDGYRVVSHPGSYLVEAQDGGAILCSPAGKTCLMAHVLDDDVMLSLDLPNHADVASVVRSIGPAARAWWGCGEVFFTAPIRPGPWAGSPRHPTGLGRANYWAREVWTPGQPPPLSARVEAWEDLGPGFYVRAS